MKTLLALLALLASPAFLQGEVIEQVLVRINGDILTKSEFEQRQVTALRQRQDLQNTSLDSPELRRVIAEITPQLVLDAVDELLLVQRGRELGLTLSEEQFTNIVNNIKRQNQLEDDARFQAALKSEGMTMADLRTQLEKNMMVQNVMSREVAQKISINDEEAKAYYEANKAAFATPSTVTLREILIAVPTSDRGVNAAQDEEAREEALRARNRLMGGEPFPRLAAEISDSGSKANGGLVGPISYNELAPDLQKVIDGLKVGDISQPLRTQRGYQLLKLEEREEVKTKTLEEARNEIGDRIGNEKLAVERIKYLDKLRSEATIVWRNDELKKAYEQALAARQNR